MKTKPFDCVEMMHQGQAESRRRLEGLGTAEKLAYWESLRAELLEWQRRKREGGRLEPLPDARSAPTP